MRIANDRESPWPVDGLRDSNARPAGDGEHRGVSNGWRHELDRGVWSKKRHAIVFESDAQCLGQLAGPVAKVSRSTRTRPVGSHVLQTSDGLERSNQNGRRIPRWPTHDIRTTVDSVAQVDIEQTGWTEHRSISFRTPAERVARRIIVTTVCLDLDDSTGPTPAAQHPTQDAGSHLICRPCEIDAERLDIHVTTTAQMRA